MEIDKKVMMSEIGGAFIVSWLVLTGMGEGSDMLMAGLVLAAVMTAMAGAHVLPMFTWMSMMTGDLADQENWMNGGMRLVAQIVGALAAILMMTEGEATDYTAGDMWGFEMWTVVTMVAAGAIIGAVHSRCEAWMTAIVVIACVGSIGMGMNGAHHMASTLMADSGNIVNTLSTWALDGVFLGAGALIGTKIDEAME